MMRSFLPLYLFLLATPAAAQVTEVETTYAISGETGRALYESIGEKGPMVGGGRAVAHTTFDLKWGRDYVAEGNACVLKRVRKFLTITITLPKPSAPLPAETEKRWRRFIAGIRAHEAVHAEYVRTMADEIEAATLGFRQENDPACREIRDAIQPALVAAYDRYKAKNRAFEEKEWSPAGSLPGLIIGLVE